MGRLFWKFFFFILLAQLTAILGIGGTLWLKHQTDEKAGGMDRRAPPGFLMDSAAATLQYGGPDALRSLMGGMRRHQVYAVDEDGRELLERKVSAAAVGQARRLLIQEGSRHMVRQVKAPDGHAYLLFFTAPERGAGGLDAPDERPPPHGDGRPPPPDDDRFHLFLPMAAAFVASLIFAALLAWYISKPIRNLRSAFEAAAAGNLETRVGAVMGKRRDELADLGRDFDLMAGKLRVLMDGQRRLLHDVSHELRSPLARLQAAIGLARQRPEKIESSMVRIERESVRMDKLVGELLTLSRLEAGVIGAMSEEIPMGELIAGIVDDARFEAENNGKTVESSGSCEAIVSGRSELLHRAIENVVRNAVKHTAGGSSVMVETRLDAQQHRLRISILDHGPGVREAELNAIFEPFFRGSWADKDSDGHGLGLAIARRVVAAHGGSIQATNRMEGGLHVEIALPLHTPS